MKRIKSQGEGALVLGTTPREPLNDRVDSLPVRGEFPRIILISRDRPSCAGGDLGDKKKVFGDVPEAAN